MLTISGIGAKEVTVQRYYWKVKRSGSVLYAATIWFYCTRRSTFGFHHGWRFKTMRRNLRPFNLIPMAAANTGATDGLVGSIKQIILLKDFQVLKMRIQVLPRSLKKVGGTPINLPVAKSSLLYRLAAIDATEWFGPYNDLAFGLYNSGEVTTTTRLSMTRVQQWKRFTIKKRLKPCQRYLQWVIVACGALASTLTC